MHTITDLQLSRLHRLLGYKQYTTGPGDTTGDCLGVRLSEFVRGVRGAETKLAAAMGLYTKRDIDLSQLAERAASELQTASSKIQERDQFLARLDKIFKRYGETPTRDLNEIARRVEKQHVELDMLLAAKKMSVERDNPPHDELKRHRQCFRDLVGLLGLTSTKATTESVVEAVEKLNHDLTYAKMARDADHQTAYLQHGEIIPATVLYSDDTTTLVRTADTDMMIETSTAVWHTEQEYRLQELVKAQPGVTSNQVATAVRVLNDLVDAGEVELVGACPEDGTCASTRTGGDNA